MFVTCIAFRALTRDVMAMAFQTLNGKGKPFHLCERPLKNVFCRSQLAGLEVLPFLCPPIRGCKESKSPAGFPVLFPSP